MPRPPRQEAPGALHHVFNRGAKRDLIYVDDIDCVRYLVWLGKVVRKYDWRPLAYCLMRNHLHLVVETPEPNLGKGMQLLHGRYAQAFNERHRESGHVFQGRYGSRRIHSDAYLWQVMQYVDHNPVEAKLCARPEDWRWGSRWAVANGVAPGWLATGRWAAFVEGIRGGPGTGASG